jgi:hypothetical protein
MKNSEISINKLRIIRLKRRLKILKEYGSLIFFKKHSNLFFVLLNWKKKHLLTLTSGNCHLGKNKKQKLAPLNLTIIIQKLKKMLEIYNIKFLTFYMRQRIAFFFNKLKKLFKLHNIMITNYKFILQRLHGKKKGRNLRRI